MSLILHKAIDAQNRLYKECGFKPVCLIREAESTEYFAHYYNLENKQIRFRIAKKTPKKVGHFVTLWKRMEDGIIGPYDECDAIDFLIITIMHENNIGQFVFPKTILLLKNILSKQKIGGKRAIRVYSPWDITDNKQSSQTKAWQLNYFIEITPNKPINTELAKRLYGV